MKHAIPRDEQNPTNHSRTNKIFLGGFPHEATEADTSEAIENYTLAVGESLNVKVEKVDIIKKNDNQPRGFCFVEMASEDDADKVVIVKYFVINGKRVELKKAEPKGAKGGMGGGMGGRGGRGGRDSNRGGGGGGGRMSSFGGGGGSWGGNMGGGGYGGGYDQYSGGGYSDYGLTGYGTYGTAGFGGGYDYSLLLPLDHLEHQMDDMVVVVVPVVAEEEVVVAEVAITVHIKNFVNLVSIFYLNMVPFSLSHISSCVKFCNSNPRFYDQL